jgi:hypothetical protein
MTVTFPEESLKKLRERIAANEQRHSIEVRLREYIARMSKDIADVVAAARVEAKSLPFGYGDDLGGYLDELDIRKQLNVVLEEMEKVSYYGKGEKLEGDVFYVAEDFVDVEMSCASDEFSRLSNCKEASFWEYNPQTQQAFMVDVLRYGDDPHSEIEYKVYFIINPMQDGPYQVAAKVVPAE